MIATELKEEILKRREDRLKRESTVYPRNNPTASSLSECAREMVLSILFWQQVPPFDTYVKARLEEGQRQENYVLQELLGLGFTITENNPPPFEIKDRKGRLIMRGKIDGKCLWKDRRVPFEVKSMNSNVFAGVNTMQDFYKYFWMKRYVLQMMSYLYANDEQEGVFIIVDMQGHWKVIELSLDMEIMEGILQLCERVVDSVQRCREESVVFGSTGTDSKELPPYHADLSVCRRCKINNILCFPPMNFGAGAQVIDDIELIESLKRRGELQELSKEYDSLDKKIKERLKDVPLAIAGDYQIIGEEKTRHMKAQPAKEAVVQKYWQTRIEKI